MANKKYKLQFKEGKMPEFIGKLSTLNLIGDAIYMDFTSTDMYMYTVASVGNQLRAFRSYMLNLNDYFVHNIDVVDEPVYFYMRNSKNFVKNLGFFTGNITLELCIGKDFNDKDVIDKINVNSDKLKISWLCGDNYESVITREKMMSNSDERNADAKFVVSKEDAMNIRKLSNINTQYDRIEFSIENGRVFASQGTIWKMYLCDIDFESYIAVIQRSHLAYIDYSDENINFEIHSNFLGVRQDDSILMIIYEQEV